MTTGLDKAITHIMERLESLPEKADAFQELRSMMDYLTAHKDEIAPPLRFEHDELQDGWFPIDKNGNRNWFGLHKSQWEAWCRENNLRAVFVFENTNNVEAGGEAGAVTTVESQSNCRLNPGTLTAPPADDKDGG